MYINKEKQRQLLCKIGSTGFTGYRDNIHGIYHVIKFL